MQPTVLLESVAKQLTYSNDIIICQTLSQASELQVNTVYNKEPIYKEKATEKTYVHLQGIKKKWCQAMLFVSLQYLMTSYNTQYKHHFDYLP